MPSPLKECTCDRCGGKKVSDRTWYYHLKSQRKRNLEEALQNLEIGPTTEQEQRLVPEEDRDDNLANQPPRYMREPASGSRDGSPQFFGPPTRSPSPEQDPISSSLNEDASGTQDLARPHLTEDVSGTRDLARPHLTEDVPGQEDPLFDDVDDEDLPFFDVGDNDPNWTGDEDPPWMDEEGDFLDEEGDFLDDIDRDPGAFSFEIDLSLQYIKALKNASLENGELDQKTLDRLRNPPQYPLSKSLDKPTQISLDVFLSLSNFSQAAYNGVREVFMRNDPKVELLSYDRCKTLMAQLTGVIPVMQDMCMNSCHAFTGPLSDKEACVYCGAPRFENKGRKKVPVKQSTWFPIGTQLQAQCRSPEGAERMRHRDRRTDAILEELVANGGEIPVYDDVFHGSEYLEAVSQGKITSNTIVFVLSIDGAQLYRSKQSDCTIYIWVIYNLAPDIRYKKRYVLIGGIIPGPSSPKNIDSFIFSSLNHVAALQKEGLQVWDGSLEETILVTLFLLLITADTVGIKEFTGFVGHQGANSCRGFCPQKGRHVCGASTYYPAALRPHDSPHLPTNSAHPDIDISEFSLPDAARYRTLLKYVLESSSLREYKRRRLETGIVKPSIILGMPSSHRPLSVRCFTLDTMHLTALNIPHLLLALWSGQLKCSKHDSVDRWEFAVLRGDTWEQHGEVVVGMKPYLPGSFEDAPRNPAEKVNSGYKAWEFLIYMFVLGPAVFRGILPPQFYRNFCKLVAGVRIILQQSITSTQLEAAHSLFIDFSIEFEELYYQRNIHRLQFIRPAIHSLQHLSPETYRNGPLTLVSQWVLERTIGNLGEELRQHSNPFANLASRALTRCWVNALKASAPDLGPQENKQTVRARYSVGEDRILLWPSDIYVLNDNETKAVKQYLAENGTPVEDLEDLCVQRWARLQLPTGQIARCLWKEKNSKLTDSRMSRNVKFHTDSSPLPFFGEVQFYFQLDLDDVLENLAMVVMYSPRDPEMYSILHGTLHVCQYLGETGLKVIKVSQIDAVVGVPPLPFTQDEIDATQQDARVSQILSNRYFIAEKPELDTCYQTYDNENSSDCEDEEEE